MKKILIAITASTLLISGVVFSAAKHFELSTSITPAPVQVPMGYAGTGVADYRNDMQKAQTLDAIVALAPSGLAGSNFTAEQLSSYPHKTVKVDLSAQGALALRNRALRFIADDKAMQDFGPRPTPVLIFTTGQLKGQAYAAKELDPNLSTQQQVIFEPVKTEAAAPAPQAP